MSEKENAVKAEEAVTSQGDKDKENFKKNVLVTLIAAVVVIMVYSIIHFALLTHDTTKEQIRVGFVYDSDDVTPYTANFIKAQKSIERHLGDKVLISIKANIRDVSRCDGAISDLVAEGCDIIFTTSYGYGEAAKKYAALHPDIQFCEATCDNANQDPVLDNYHTFMGEIYQGRYISGAVAGLKLNEMIEKGEITPEGARLGYVAAFPSTEVISGYTAFFLGVRSVCPSAVMDVKYTNTWGNYAIEKKVAKEFIDDGCVIISQHSDTTGPAVACEEAFAYKNVYHVGYNQSMIDVAPTSSLISSRINWEPYMTGACEAVLKDKEIEDHVKGHVHGRDIGAGFDYGWLEMMNLNKIIAADGSEELIDKLISEFKEGGNDVFKGPYTGTDPNDPSKTIDISGGYIENENSSAPTFGYVLNDVIRIKE
ncbi:basic membrane protein A [Ruminococcaceae bacterium FB2012]|nr:basic membrane protein A [Ruminococcaceae bacterium FB2012]